MKEEKHGPFKKKIPTETNSEKNQMNTQPDSFENNQLKDAQRTKGRQW